VYFLVIGRGVFIDKIHHVGEDRDEAIRVAAVLCNESKGKATEGFWILGHDGQNEFKVGCVIEGVGFVDSLRRR
jgi:hypothetical protein